MQIASAGSIVSQTTASLMSELGRTKAMTANQSASVFTGSVASSAPPAGASGNALIGNARPSLSDQVMGFLMQQQQENGAGPGKSPGFTTTTPISETSDIGS